MPSYEKLASLYDGYVMEQVLSPNNAIRSVPEHDVLFAVFHLCVSSGVIVAVFLQNKECSNRTLATLQVSGTSVISVCVCKDM